MPDCTIKNNAPDADDILIKIESWEISISRDEQGTVFVCVNDTEEGSSTRMILGQVGETQKL